MQTAFYPDRARFFHPFEQEYQMVLGLAQQMQSKGLHSMPDALFLSWGSSREDDATTRLRLIGSENFYYRLSRALADAQEGIQTILDKYLEVYKDRIDPVDEIGSCNDPVLLLQIADGGIDGAGHRFDRASRIEAQRKLAIAFQLLAIGAVDPFELVSSDLTEITLLSRRRLFEPTDRVTLVVWFALNTKEANHVYHDESAVSVTDAPKSIPDGLVLKKQEISCRMVLDGARKYYVQTHSRPKSRISAVIKLERGGELNDRRAMRHVLIAVQDGQAIRAATQDDIAPFVDLARRRLWNEELVEDVDTSAPNPFRDSRYIDQKVIGRYFKTGRPYFLPRVEHQVTCVRAHLNGEHATDDLNHHNYKGKILRKTILHRWWAEEWYGIAWRPAP